MQDSGFEDTNLTSPETNLFTKLIQGRTLLSFISWNKQFDKALSWNNCWEDTNSVHMISIDDREMQLNFCKVQNKQR